jgi:peptidoglycan/xylan/chitin deacetylase (PgdA/CDA1 family)
MLNICINMKVIKFLVLLLYISLGGLTSLIWGQGVRTLQNNGLSVDNIEIPKWFNNAAAAIALTFDDGFKAHYDYAFPILEKYNIKGTFYVNSGYLKNKGQLQLGRGGYWEDFAEMAAAGHEIGSHSVKHLDLTSLTAENLHNELANDKAVIESKIKTQKCLTHAYPSSRFNQTVRDTASHYFLAARQGGKVGANNSSLSQNDWMGVWSNALTWGTSRNLLNEMSVAMTNENEIVNQLITTEKFGIYCIHEVLPFEKLNTTTSWEPCTTEWLEEICKFLDERRNTKEVWPTTLVNITRYSRMRDQLEATNIYKSVDSLAYSFNDILDDEIYNLPITVNIILPLEFENVMVYKNNILIETVTVVNQRVQVSVVPDREVISIKKNNILSVESELLSNFHCYPSPFNQDFFIEIDRDFPNATICLNDLGGKLLSSEKRNLVANSPNRFVFKNLPKGQYIMSLFEKEVKIAQQKIFH